MELFIAGGCGEHGRNCFYVEQNEAAFLVDCGLLAGAEDNLPRLNAEMLENGQMLFLRYPVHLDLNQCHKLAAQNQFNRVVPYHSPGIRCQKSFEL